VTRARDDDDALVSSRVTRAGLLKVLVSLVAGACLVWVMRAGGLPVVPPASAFSQVRWSLVALFGALWLFVMFVRSARWYFLLAPIQRVPLRTLLVVSFLGLGALVLFPLRTGELVRPALIRTRAKVSAWAAAGTIGAERVIDGLFLSTLLFCALRASTPIDPLPERIGDLPVPVAAVPSAAYVALTIFAAAFVAMGMFYWRRQFARELTRRVIGVVSLPLAERIAGLVENVSDGLSFLPRARYAGPFIACTALYWLANGLGVYVLLHACGLSSATVPEAIAILGILALGILTPNAPGLFGTFQLSLYAGLAMFFPPEQITSQGAAFVFVLYVLQVGLTLLVSALALLFDLAQAPRSNPSRTNASVS
jgi:uncharacterized protein (TIRG00374 family)